MTIIVADVMHVLNKHIIVGVGKGSKQGKDSKGKKKDKGEESKPPAIVSSGMHKSIDFRMHNVTDMLSACIKMLCNEAGATKSDSLFQLWAY